jgi:hypothetical protein
VAQRTAGCRQPRVLCLGAGALLSLFLGSIAINFVAGQLIGAAKVAGDEPRAARLTFAAVAVNLLILGFWKYAVFAVRQLDSAVGVFGGEIHVPSIALPIGISFFTFHGISYVVDVHRGRAEPMRRPTDYVQYMAFFPQLIAGPIVPLPRDQRPDPHAAPAVGAARRHRRRLPALRARALQEGPHRRPGGADRRTPPSRPATAG